MSTKKLSELDIKKIKELKEKGISSKNISKAFGVSTGAIYYVIKYGKPYEPNRTSRAKLITKQRRERNRLSKQDILDIAKAIDKGETKPSIAKRYDINIRSVYRILKRTNQIELPFTQTNTLVPQPMKVEEVKPKLLSEKLIASMGKAVSAESLYESRLNQLSQKAITETASALSVICNNKLLASNGKLVIRKNALMNSIYAEDWNIDVFSKGWKEISTKISDYLSEEGFEVQKDINDNSVIVSWG